MIYLLSFSFAACMVMYSKYQFEEQQGKSVGKWHGWGMVMRLLIFVIMAYCCHFTPTFKDVLLSATLSWLLWDIGINTIALRMPLFYSSNAHRWSIDRALRKVKWYLYLAAIIGAVLFRVL